ncbi:trypsin-like serine protease [Arthrobacter sp. ZGTC131]|uniref:trypsin-like serine protease n=1 Tax=Arthrobacter sp. ZGTC131 TaxID=2058898 RepID=UPI000CE2BAF4|nr:trypsin-like serine protease [Arthrobacter sp. ZGTC131]
MRALKKLRAGIGAMAAVAALVMTTAVPAGAVTGDYVEDHEHPFVGLIVFYDTDGSFHHRCSGSLLSPTVFLTAGHCTAGATSARVYFQQDAGAGWSPETGTDPDTGYPDACAEGTLGTLCAESDEIYNYGFTGLDAVPETKDAGLVILKKPIALPEYATLAAPGTLDALAAKRGQQETTFSASGFGVSDVNPVSTTSFRERLMAESKLTNLTSATNDGYNVQTNGNGNGRGGTCTADSGGPLFYGPLSSNIITGIISFGHNRYCKGTGFSYRTDRQDVIEWITSTAGLEPASIVVEDPAGH